MSVLVEECFALNTAFFKRDLGRARRREDNIGGKIDIFSGDQKKEVSYWVEYEGDNAYLIVSLNNQEEPQKILLVDYELNFGTRTYFVCECGSLASKLYMLPCGSEFKCWKCHGLRYKLTTFNRNSLSGEFLYRATRAEKLDSNRAAMKRIIYGRRYTQKFLKYLAGCRKIGFGQVAEVAESAMEAMQNLKPMNNNFR